MKRLLLPMLATIGIVAQAMESGLAGLCCLDTRGYKQLVTFKSDIQCFFTIFSRPGSAVAKDLGMFVPTPLENIPLWPIYLAPISADEKSDMAHELITVIRETAGVYKCWGEEIAVARLLQLLTGNRFQVTQFRQLQAALKLLGTNQELMHVFEKGEMAYPEKLLRDKDEDDCTCVP